MRHVIIGAGPAGVLAAETLRDIDAGADVTLIGNEALPPYSRMALPYFLAGNIGAEGTWLRKDRGHYDEAGITLKKGRVTALHPERNSLTLEDGATLSWDRLLLATGSSAICPDLPGADLPGVHCAWTLEDAHNILRLAQPAARVLLVGAGFIGCIILEALVRRGVQLRVVEMEERMVARMMDETSSRLLQRWCAARDVQVQTSTRVQAVEQVDGALRVQLNGGNAVAADLLIWATGVRPNMDFLADSGVHVDYGVLVNEYMQTSIPTIYAAGDVCQGKDFSTGNYSVQAIQPTATEHGRLAALNMCGRTVRHQGCINMNVLDTMGLISTSYGKWMGSEGGDGVTLCDEERFRYLNLQFEEDVLVGAQALGLIGHVGVLRGLIQSRLHLGDWKQHLLDNPERLMEAYLGATQAIGHNAGLLPT